MLDSAFVAYVPAGAASATDKAVLPPSTTFTPGYVLDRVGTDSISAPYTSPAAPPPPALGTLGFYYDPNGHATAQDCEALAAFLSTGGKKVTAEATNTYTGGDSWASIGSFVPFNGVVPPPGWIALISMAYNPGSYTPANGTLLAGVQANLGQFQALFNRIVTLVGKGKSIWRIGYEINGNWPAPAAYTGFKASDVMATISLLSKTLKAIDPTALVNFNLNGNGPTPVTFQDGQGMDAWCPYDDVDIISVNNYYNGPGTSAYGVGHCTPVIDAAQAHGKEWAVPEYGVTGTAGADAVAWFNDMASLIKGLPTLNRQTNVAYTPFAAAKYHAYFSTDDNSPGSNLEDSDNANIAAAFTAAFGV